MLKLLEVLTIGKRLAMGFGLVLLLIVVITAVGIDKVAYINTTLTEITDVNAVKQRYAINFRGSVHDRAISLRDLTLVSDTNEQNAIMDEMMRLAEFYSKSANAMDRIFSSTGNKSGDERVILGSIKEIEATTMPLMQQVVAAKMAGNSYESQTILLQHARPALKEWLARINMFIDYQEKKNQHKTASTREVASGFAELMIFLSILAITIGSSVAFLITYQLKRSLGGEPGEAVDLLRQIADGDLTTNIEVEHEDSMLGAVAQMQNRLRGIFSDVIGAAQEMTVRAEDVATSSQQAKNSAEIQAESSLISAASINQMSMSINDVTSMAKQTELNSALTSELASNGADLVDTAANEIARVVEMVKSSSERISQLQKRSEDIGGIAKVIKDVADKTNLLALNAAIEAARAGEAGRGFAVVADEVRSLAVQTASATSDIASVIELIQRETNSAVNAMEAAAPQVENGLALAKEANSMLKEIYQQAAGSLNNVRDVVLVSSEQATSANDIASHVQQIAVMSKETHIAMESNTSAATELESIAQKLRGNVSYFRIN